MKFGSGKGMHDLTKPLGKYTEKPTSFRSTLLEQLTELISIIKILGVIITMFSRGDLIEMDPFKVI